MAKTYNSKYSANHPLVVTTYEMRAGGSTMTEIAKAVGLNTGQVWRFLNTPAYDPANRGKQAASPVSTASPVNVAAKTRPVRVQGLSVRADDGRHVELEGVVCEKRDGGDRFTITVFVPHPLA